MQYQAQEPTEAAEWRRRMEPVLQRVPLEEVANWWADTWEWRTRLLEAGTGNMYDGHPSTRVPWSMTTSKFPWLTVEDRVDYEKVVAQVMKSRAKANPELWGSFYRSYRKEVRDFYRGHKVPEGLL
jgi:hypothetical protein